MTMMEDTLDTQGGLSSAIQHMLLHLHTAMSGGVPQPETCSQEPAHHQVHVQAQIISQHCVYKRLV